MKQKSTVLIVDDERLIREAFDALLSSQGYNLIFAANGVEAIEKAQETTPDLILLDVMMPGMDGFEVCRKLRADPRLGEVPIIMVTALHDRQSRLEGIEAGADDFITKPFDSIELRARVKTVIRLNRYRRLLAERAKFEWVVAQADSGYLIINNEDDVLYANPRARLYLGMPQDEEEADLVKFLDLAERSYRCEPRESWMNWPAGEDSTCATAKDPCYLVRSEEENTPPLWLQVDVMEMFFQEDERYLIRLRDVTSKVLEQRSMWTFHSLVSHKIRTPLNLLLGFLNLLERKDVPLSEEEQDNYLTAAHNGAVRLQEVIQDIFQYMQALDMAQVGFARCALAAIPEIVEEIKNSLEIEEVEVIYDGIEDRDTACLPLSAQAVELILWELFENAKKFHPQQSPKLEIVLSRVPEGVRLQIRDDGTSLSSDQLARIWIPYYQVEKRFTGQVPGMGLGLSMVASLVWEARGTCHAYNREDGAGIVIEINMPLKKYDEDDDF